MDFFGFFRRTPPIRDERQLADMIDEQAAFLVQKGMYEYSRALAGPQAKSMLKEAGFIDAVNDARWRAFPLGLSMVGEMTEGVLRPHAGEDRRAMLDTLIALVLSVFDRYPRPGTISAPEWTQARDELKLHLERVSTHPPKPVTDIPVPFAERYFNMMPIHETMRSNDAPTTRSFLQLTLHNIREELLKRIDAPALAARLKGMAAEKV